MQSAVNPTQRYEELQPEVEKVIGHFTGLKRLHFADLDKDEVGLVYSIIYEKYRAKISLLSNEKDLPKHLLPSLEDLSLRLDRAYDHVVRSF